MKQSTVKKYMEILQAVKASGETLNKFCTKNKLNYNSITSAISSLKKISDKETEDVRELISLYNTVIKKPIQEEIDTDDRSNISYLRGDDGRIQYYSYQIYRQDKAPLSGKLTREEMNTIHRLYSYYGDSLPQRIVSRHFTDLSLVDFKRILRAFNITKAACPFAPHMIEEKSEEELREIQLREKENSFLRKAEEDHIKNNEILLRKYAQENIELRNKFNQRKELLDGLLSYDIKVSSKIENNSCPENTDIVIVLSDLHIGAHNEKYGYLPLESYTESEITRRLNKIIGSLWDMYDSITVLNLGDSVDSYNKQTTRGGHDLPAVITDKEQSELYQRIMTEFFAKLTAFSEKINYVCVGEANHDGDWGWINNIVLSHIIKDKFGIESYISNTPIDSFNVQECSITFLHGKDNKNQFKNFPLTINDKTENWFNNYFLDCGKNLPSKRYVIKGDLHQFAYTRAKHFDYISAPSLYGSSNWIAANFGKTPWGALILEINNNNVRTELVGD